MKLQIRKIVLGLFFVSIALPGLKCAANSDQESKSKTTIVPSFKYADGTSISTETQDEWSPVLLKVGDTTHMYFLSGTYSRTGDTAAVLNHATMNAEGSFDKAALWGAESTLSLSQAATVQSGACGGNVSTLDIKKTDGTIDTYDFKKPYTPGYTGFTGFEMENGEDYIMFTSVTNTVKGYDSGACIVPLDKDGKLDMVNAQPYIAGTNVDSTTKTFDRADVVIGGSVPIGYNGTVTLASIVNDKTNLTVAVPNVYVVPYNDATYGMTKFKSSTFPTLILVSGSVKEIDTLLTPLKKYEYVNAAFYKISEFNNFPLPFISMIDKEKGTNANIVLLGPDKVEPIKLLEHTTADDVTPWILPDGKGDGTLYLSSKGRDGNTYDLYRLNQPRVSQLASDIVNLLLGETLKFGGI